MNHRKLWNTTLIVACMCTSPLLGDTLKLASSPALIGSAMVLNGYDSIHAYAGDGAELDFTVCPFGSERTNYAQQIAQHNTQYPNAPYTLAVVKVYEDGNKMSAVLSAREAVRQFHMPGTGRTILRPGMTHIVTSFYRVSPDDYCNGTACYLGSMSPDKQIISNVGLLRSVAVMAPSDWEICDKGGEKQEPVESASRSHQHEEVPKAPTYEGETDFDTWAKKVVKGTLGYHLSNLMGSREHPYFIGEDRSLDAEKIRVGLWLTWQLGLASENKSAWNQQN